MLKVSPFAIALSAVALCSTVPAFAEPPAAVPPQSAPAPPQSAPAPSQSAPPPGYGVPVSGYSVPPGPPLPGYPPPYGQGAPPVSAEPPPEALMRYERRSSGLMMGGIVLTTVGGVGMIGAGILASSAAACSDCASYTRDNKAIISLTMLITGAICVGIGIPMIVWGGKRVPRNPGQPVAKAVAARWPGGGGLVWRF